LRITNFLELRKAEVRRTRKANFRLCEVAPFGSHPRSARHGSTGREVFHFGVHVSIRADGRLLDGTNPKDRLKVQLTPKFYKVRDVLRAEVEASRGIVSWFRYHIVNRMKRRG
jgi:hypothetical protein